MKKSSNLDPESYVFERLPHRLVGNAALAAVFLPVLSRHLRPPITRCLNYLLLPKFLAVCWLPSSFELSFLVGIGAGALEDYHARVAWFHAKETGIALEPPMWTARTLLPSMAFCVNPFMGLKALDGEMKGADCALAVIERRPIQIWPFYAVLDVHRPSPDGSNLM